MMASGMEVGINEGYEKLDELLERGPAHERPPTSTAGWPAGFTDRVRGASDWDAPGPGRGLGRARRRTPPRRVVPRRSSQAGAGVELPHGPSVDDDPVAAWQVHARRGPGAARRPGDAVEGADQPRTSARCRSTEAVDQFYTSDVFMHTWDLARATGQDETLDPDEVRGAAGRHGADGRGAAAERSVRREGRRCRTTPTCRPDAGLHRPQPALSRRSGRVRRAGCLAGRPRAADHLAQVVPHLPADVARGELAAGHDLRRVARTARRGSRARSRSRSRRGSRP